MDTPTAPAAAAAEVAVNKEERTWAMFAHLSAFVGHFIPFGHIFGPLIIWMIKKPNMPFAADQAKEALNFQITMTIAFLAAAALCLIAIGFLLLPVVWLFDIIFTIVAAVKANDGVTYRYPATLRVVN
jgi:uncharacterized Tic20 family protein